MSAHKVIFHLRYPKVYLLVVFVLLATIFYWNDFLLGTIASLGAMTYVVSFFAGMFFALGLTAPFAAGFFGLTVPENIFLAAIMSGLGAMVIDALIFGYVKKALMEKLAKAKCEYVPKRVKRLLTHERGATVLPYISFVLAGLVIALPLPGHLDAVLVCGMTKLRRVGVALMSFFIYFMAALFFLSLKFIIPFATGLLGMI